MAHQELGKIYYVLFSPTTPYGPTFFEPKFGCSWPDPKLGNSWQDPPNVPGSSTLPAVARDEKLIEAYQRQQPCRIREQQTL